MGYYYSIMQISLPSDLYHSSFYYEVDRLQCGYCLECGNGLITALLAIYSLAPLKNILTPTSAKATLFKFPYHKGNI